MTIGRWPALDTVLEALRTTPSRTGSVVVTLYGDAILPRGGSLALSDLLALMHRLGAAEGVVRTAVSRLAADGLLTGRRSGRRSSYALTERGEAEFRAAIPNIYGVPHPAWDGHLHLAFPQPGADRIALEQAGYPMLAPGVLVSPAPIPTSAPTLLASGPAEALHDLVSRAWPIDRLAHDYVGFVALIEPLEPVPALEPLEAMAARTVLIHAWRRIALRDPRLPAALLPADWPGIAARDRCAALYRALADCSERWLDHAEGADGRLPSGPDPAMRFG